MQRVRAVAAAAVALALVLGACTGDDGDAATATTSTAPGQRPAPPTTGAPPTPTTTAAGHGRPGALPPETPDETVEYPTRDGKAFAADVYLPDGPGPYRALMLVHAGGYRRGSRVGFAGFAGAARAAGYAVFSVDYRLKEVPGHPGEANDVADAIAWIRDAYPVASIGLLGASAGGTLALLDAELVDAVVSSSGPTDFLSLPEHSPSPTVVADIVTDYLGCDAATCPGQWEAASPTAAVSGDEAPTLFLHTETDIVPAQQAAVLGPLLRDAGVEVESYVRPGGGHGVVLAEAEIDRILGFFDRHL